MDTKNGYFLSCYPPSIGGGAQLMKVEWGRIIMSSKKAIKVVPEYDSTTMYDLEGNILWSRTKIPPILNIKDLTISIK